MTNVNIVQCKNIENTIGTIRELRKNQKKIENYPINKNKFTHFIRADLSKNDVISCLTKKKVKKRCNILQSWLLVYKVLNHHLIP